MIDKIALNHLNKILSNHERPHLDNIRKASHTELIWCIRSMQKELKQLAKAKGE